MRTLTVNEAVKYCVDNTFKKDSWDCGYVLEVYLNSVGICLELDTSWVELENVLFYNNA